MGRGLKPITVNLLNGSPSYNHSYAINLNMYRGKNRAIKNRRMYQK
jgi:hypothetical protein